MLFFSLMCIFDIFVKVAVGVGLCLSPLSCSTDLSICVCAMLFVLLWLCSIWDQEWLPTAVFFCAGLSGLSCLVCLHTKFKNFFFLDLLRKVWYLYWTWRLLLVEWPFFTILILPIHEHGKIFHLLVSSSFSFFSILKVFVVEAFHLLCEIYSQVLYVCVCHCCEWDCFLQSSSVYLALNGRKLLIFMLVLYPDSMWVEYDQNNYM